MHDLSNPLCIRRFRQEFSLVLVQSLAIRSATCLLCEFKKVDILVAIVVASAQNSLNILPFWIILVLLEEVHQIVQRDRFLVLRQLAEGFFLRESRLA